MAQTDPFIVWFLAALAGHKGLVAFCAALILGVIIMFGKGIITINWPRRKNNNHDEKMSKETRSHLYNLDGTPKFMPRSSCLEDRAKCQELILSKIEDIRSAVEKSEQAREKGNDDRVKELKEINQFIGRVEQFIVDVRTELKSRKG